MTARFKASIPAKKTQFSEDFPDAVIRGAGELTLRAKKDCLPLFAVTMLHHRCLLAIMSRDRLVSAGRLLTISEFWPAGRTAPALISRVSLQVQRRPVSIFTTNPLPAEVQMCSVMKCRQPTRIAVGRAHVQLVFAQSH